MEWLKVSEADAVERALAVLGSGGVAVFPAERLYGLAADATNAEAVRKVFALKGRHPDQAVPVLVADANAAREWVEISEGAERFVRAFWPGPLTLVLPLRRELPPEVTGGSDLLGLRVPGNVLARELARRFQKPLTATSANPSGAIEAKTVTEAVAWLYGDADLVLDAGELPGPPGSTVVKVGARDFEVLRTGVITAAQLASAWKEKK